MLNFLPRYRGEPQRLLAAYFEVMLALAWEGDRSKSDLVRQKS
jgi:hypothetical protein